MLDCVKHWCSIIPPMQVAATFVTNHCSLTDLCDTRVWFKVNSTKDEEDMCHKCSHLLINTKAKGQFYHVEYIKSPCCTSIFLQLMRSHVPLHFIG